MKNKYVLLLFLFLPSISLAFRKPTLLIVGDSHSTMDFGSSMAAQLGASFDVKRYAVCSGSAPTFLKDKVCPAGTNCPYRCGYTTPDGTFNKVVPSTFPGVNGMLSKQTPVDMVVIALGTNDGNNSCRTPSGAIQKMRDLIGRLHGRACFWVGPPAYGPGTEIYRVCGNTYDQFVSLMRTAVSALGCRFIDSREIFDPQTGKPIAADRGIHFSKRLGTVWGTEAAKSVR